MPPKEYNDTRRAIENKLFATYGCLLPVGEVSGTLIRPWTKESILVELKRSGRILSWEQDKAFEEGNNRRYHITLDTDRI